MADLEETTFKIKSRPLQAAWTRVTGEGANLEKGGLRFGSKIPITS